MLSPREHVERIRRERYFIGRGEKNPLAEDMHQAVNYLSQELYSKDVHFLMELVQNAEDNEYPSGVAPSLEFIITSKDITRSGASSTLLVFNNEKGFGPENIESICRIGKSTKKGNRKHGYIGEKGIGFKSVFLVSSKPHIFSNGYQIKFDEEPSAECGVGYIVPNWVEETPTLSDIFKIYGSSNSLPTTVIILPIKSGKIDAVKEELLGTHPEILLFLSKIRQLSVREIDGDLSATSVSHICISSEADALTRKDIGTESCTLHLSAQEDETGEHQCSYYIWKQHFPVKPECRVQRRAGVEEWVIMLAFPHGQRLSQEAGSPGVFAFLPTAMATNFPFIIQADFLLSSSRESILLDNLWNRGILDYVPFAFRNAFVALVKSTESAPVFALAPVFKFLPVHRSPVPLLDSVRLSIRNELVDTDIVPCETCSALKLFCKPTDVGRLDAAFWSILNKAAKLGAELPNISSHGIHILSSYFDNEEYNDVLAFLGISYVDVEWYAKCIRGSNLAVQLPEEVYVDLLAFVAENWCVKFVGTNMEHVLFIKCVGTDGEVSYRSVEEATTGDEKLCMVSDEDCVSSLINWNKEFFSTISRLFFMPLDTQKALEVSPEKATVMEWLQKYVCMKVLTLHEYVLTVAKGLHEKRQVLAFTRFVYQLHVEKYIPEWTLQHICSIMPIVNTSGHIITGSRVVLFPAKGSKWAALMGKNPWTAENYVDLAEDYLSAVSFAGFHASEDHLLSFLKIYMQSTDVPFLHPPDAGFSAVSCPLRMESALILLEWIQNLRLRGVGLPKKFLSCVMHGSWLKTYVGYRPPSESFLSNGQWGSLFQNQPAFVDIPMIDQDFYENKIAAYNEELGAIGVRFKLEEAMAYIGKRFMSMAIGDTPIIDLVFSLLQFIRHLRQHHTSPHHLIQSISNGRWLKTCLGYRCPIESILFTPEWSVPSQISTLPFIDIDFYGEDIADYKSELGLLGVLINFKQNYQIVVDNFNFPKGSVTADGAVLMLKCIRYADSCKNLVKGLKKRQWLKTSVGFRAPRQTFLLDPEWKCLLKFVDIIALLDLPFYGDELLLYREELRRTGLIVSLEEASKAITCHLKQLLLTSSLTKEIRIVLLSSYRELNREHRTFPADLLNFMHTEKWLHTSHGFRSPKKCILFDATWEPLVPVASLPFIDDSDTQNGAGKEIYSYKTELKALGAIVEFNQGSDLVRSGLTINAGHSLCVPINVISRVSTIADMQSSHARGSPHAVRSTRETTDGNMQASSVAENISLLVTPSSLYSLLKCMQNSIDPESFADRIRKMPMKTTVGHRYADECILFDATWSSYLRKEDGPFIDEAFYGPEILSYKTELRLIGVILDVCSGCPLMAQHLKHHSEVARLSRIYRYLALFKWEPRNKTENWIWIPSGSSRGQWARSTDCVLHDKNSLFDKRFHALDKYYDKDLLAFFSMVLGVKHGPRVLDHFMLWRSWECTSSELTPPNCSAFWEFIGNRWNAMTEKLMLGCVTKVPVLVGDKIILSDVQDVFVPDDLLLKDLFDKLSAQSIFVWYPSTRLSFTLRARMDTIYRSVGVRAISKAAVKDESFMLKARCCQVVQERRTVVTPGLLRVILAFLADPTLGIATEKRHQMVSCLLGVTVLETEEPITMSYRVALSSGRMAVVKASRMFRWERESYKMYMQKAEAPLGKKTRMELATCFAEEISQGLLYERVDLVLALTELVKLGFLVGFEEAEVEFLLKTKNLQLFSEDAGLLSNSELANRCCF